MGVAADPLDATVQRIARSIRLTGGEELVEGTEEAPELTDITLEQHALIAMILLPDVLRDHVALGIEPWDYTMPAHVLLYSTLLDIWGQGLSWDLLVLHHRLRGEKTYEEVGGLTYLHTLAAVCTHISLFQAPEWARLIHEMAMRRTLAGIGPKIREAALSAPDLASAAQRAHEVLAASLQETGVPQPSAHSRDILARAALTTAYKTPWGALDFFTRGGVAKKQVWTLAGTSSHGKTTIALNIVHAVLGGGAKVAYFNLDSDSAALLYRLIALEAKCSREAAALPVKPQSQEGERAWTARAKFTEGAWADAYKTYATFRDLARIMAEARRHKMAYGLDVLVVDFIQNVTVGNLDEYNALGRCMTAFQQLSQVEDVAVLLLSQTSLEQQKGQRSSDAQNAKGNAAVKDNSDVFMTLYRDRFSENDDEKHVMELRVQKVKEGAVGPVALWFHFDTGIVEQRELHFQDAAYKHYFKTHAAGGEG